VKKTQKGEEENRKEIPPGQGGGGEKDHKTGFLGKIKNFAG